MQAKKKNRKLFLFSCFSVIFFRPLSVKCCALTGTLNRYVPRRPPSSGEGGRVGRCVWRLWRTRTRALEEEMKEEEKPNERERDERPARRSGGFRAEKNREKEKRPPLPSALTIKPKNHEILASLESYDQIPLFQEFCNGCAISTRGVRDREFFDPRERFHGREGRRWRAAQKPAQPSRPRSDQKKHPSIDRPRQRR